MTLITSISGIRGTIGGKAGQGLSPLDIVNYSAAYGTWLQKKNKDKKLKVVIGRDARLSGAMVNHLVSGTLQALGIDVINLSLSTTPTVEMAVKGEHADGGIIITASHNPKQWNALKLLNHDGEFISGEDGAELEKIIQDSSYEFCDVDDLGHEVLDASYLQKHVDAILEIPLVDVDLVKSKKYKIVVDAVNSSGGIYVPYLLREMGVEVVELYCEPTGKFPHNPEPLPEHLNALSTEVLKEKADMGIVVDPDVDRLAFVCEDGSTFGEEYTLVSIADYVLSHAKKGNSVSNLSSTRALKEITEKHGGKYFASAVGEVNVVKLMKKENAIIGGEGNGGIIVPELHYGRDALVGIALFLTHMAKSEMTCSHLRNTYPNYYITKAKVDLDPTVDITKLLENIQKKYKNQPINTEDGIKIWFDEDWVHLRRSNTEAIIRIYAESTSENQANSLANKIQQDFAELISNR